MAEKGWPLATFLSRYRWTFLVGVAGTLVMLLLFSLALSSAREAGEHVLPLWYVLLTLPSTLLHSGFYRLTGFEIPYFQWLCVFVQFAALGLVVDIFRRK
jgi:hypothetical protein